VVAWFEPYAAFVIYLLTPLFFVVPPQRHPAPATPSASAASRSMRR
jgi:hypothetical protein